MKKSKVIIECLSNMHKRFVCAKIGQMMGGRSARPTRSRTDAEPASLPKSLMILMYLFLCVFGFCDALGQAADAAPVAWDTFADTWSAVDGLGRRIAEGRDAGVPKGGRTVGVFYYTWHGMQKSNGGHAGPYDITKILAENPGDPKWGPVHSFHHWGEPLFGYYLTDDEFVIRRHCQMLADAGVDVIVFDATNGLIYKDEFLNICRIYADIRKAGGRTPQVAFLLNSQATGTGDSLYEHFYSKNLYPELWFKWKGKPLMMVDPTQVRKELQDFFTTRHSWAWTKGHGWFADGRDKWPWLDFYPQNFGWHDDPSKPEQLTVSVAQHPISNTGRSYHEGKEPAPEKYETAKGLYFGEQWKRVLEVVPEFVFITQWNEWTAQRFINNDGMSMMGKPLRKGDSFFVDEYSQEFSRDVEPMKGGHGDAYYWQMVDGIRRYKGARSVPAPSAPVTVDFAGNFVEWSSVGPEYRDDIGDVVHRDHQGVGTAGPYVVKTGRNDFKTAKVARDGSNVWFYVQTVNPVTAPEGQNWMNLFVSIDESKGAAWESFQFMIGSLEKNPAELVLKASGGGWMWTTVGKVEYLVKDNQMAVKIPRKLLGLEDGKTALRIHFKWADNMQSPDPLDWLINGDTAPNARFRYGYDAE